MEKVSIRRYSRERMIILSLLLTICVGVRAQYYSWATHQPAVYAASVANGAAKKGAENINANTLTTTSKRMAKSMAYAETIRQGTVLWLKARQAANRYQEEARIYRRIVEEANDMLGNKLPECTRLLAGNPLSAPFSKSQITSLYLDVLDQVQLFGSIVARTDLGSFLATQYGLSLTSGDDKQNIINPVQRMKLARSVLNKLQMMNWRLTVIIMRSKYQVTWRNLYRTADPTGYRNLLAIDMYAKEIIKRF